VLRRIPYQESPKRYEYILTQKRLDLYPIIISIVDWGSIHMVDSRGRPMLHQHKNCGHMFDPVMVCSVCGNDCGGGPGVAHHRVQGWCRPCAQSFGELGCKGADRREGGLVERHGLHLARHAHAAGQLIDGGLSAAFVSTGEDNAPGRPMR
jgi:hypothetical protein